MTAGVKTGSAVAAERKTVWIDDDERRLFLIPDDVEVLEGDVRLRSASGRLRLVDPAAVSRFEVNAEEASNWATSQLAGVVSRLKDGLRDHFRLGKTGSAGREGDVNPPPGEGLDSTTPGLDLLADITDTPRDQLDGDHRAVGQALRGYLKDAVDTTLDGLSDDPERKAASRRRMREWGETLRAHGIAARDVADDPGGGAPGDGGKETPDTRSGGAG